MKSRKKDIDLIAASGKYAQVKFITIPEAPTDLKVAICRRGAKDYLVEYSEEEVREVFEADEIRPNLASITPTTFRTDNKWGMVNSRGTIILEAKYDSVEPDANDFIFLTLDSKQGFIAGGKIFEPEFDTVKIGAKEYLEVSLNGKSGYIDENDKFTTDKSEAYYNYMMFV